MAEVDARLAMRRERLCIVMACGNAEEAAEVGQQLSQVDTGTLVTYRRAEDLLLNAPAGRVALVILAGSDEPQAVSRILLTLRNRWPRCPLVVVGNDGGGAMERAARAGGANFLVRPVRSEEWSALIDHVLSVKARIANRLG